MRVPYTCSTNVHVIETACILSNDLIITHYVYQNLRKQLSITGRCIRVYGYVISFLDKYKEVENPIRYVLSH